MSQLTEEEKNMLRRLIRQKEWDIEQAKYAIHQMEKELENVESEILNGGGA